jgi:hypothetical protein
MGLPFGISLFKMNKLADSTTSSKSSGKKIRPVRAAAQQSEKSVLSVGVHTYVHAASDNSSFYLVRMFEGIILKHTGD